MEENKVVLSLKEYVDMINELKELKINSENKNVNYEVMCVNLKDDVKESQRYHLDNIISDKEFKIENPLNIKLKNYHYENIANQFIKIGITFDLVEKLVDELIIEHQKNKKEGK